MRSLNAVAIAVAICATGCPSAGTPDAGTLEFVATDAGPRTIDGGPYDCFGLSNCINGCTAAPCFEACAAESTPTAQSLNAALANCIATTCPSLDGGPCATQFSGDCQICAQNAQAAGQPCAPDTSACIEDMSGSAGNLAGTDCHALTTCLDHCQSASCQDTCVSAASSHAYQLYVIALECLDQSCSDADGGACAVGTSQACATCQSLVLGTGGACSADFSQCQSSP